MLLRIKIENFLSFYNEVEFNMFPNIKRTTFLNHIYLKQEIPLLKQSVIYGANGSGKSNLLSSINFIKRFVTNKDFLNDSLIIKSKFRLKEENSKPINILIEFKKKDIYYKYQIKLNSKEIFEKLLISGLDKKDDIVIFKRENNKIITGGNRSKEVSKAIDKLIKKNPYSSIISLNNEFPISNNEHMGFVYDWFSQDLKTLTLNRIIPSLIDLMSKNKKILKFANNIFKEIGLGIESLEIDSENINKLLEKEANSDNKLKELLTKKLDVSDGITKMKNDKVLFSIVKEKGEHIIKQFLFKQAGLDNYTGEMDIEDQSDGTVKLLNLIPALYDVIENGKIVCIDEIENSIHPTLISALVSYFSKSKSKGQLIFTTHETELLNQQRLMRPDEVWFTEKENGNSRMYSLNDFKEHNTINIKNGYMEGRYGAIPFIGKLE